MIRKLLMIGLCGSLLLMGAGGPTSAGSALQPRQFQADKPSYAFDALEPAIDAATMEVHYLRHHLGYVRNLNQAISDTGWQSPETVAEMISDLARVPAIIREIVRNNGGGHYNHSLFWRSMSPGGGGEPEGELAEAIRRDFGSFEGFKARFSKDALDRFGSGWAWLCLGPDGKLFTCSTPNQDNPLMRGVVKQPGIPILALDLWEHAYYLRYQNRRGEYVENWWSIVDWKAVAERFSVKPE